MGRRVAALADPRRAQAGRADLRRRPRRRRRRGQQVPDRRDRGDARRLPGRQVHDQRLRRRRRRHGRGDRCRRRPADRRHPLRAGDVARTVRRGVRRPAGRPSTRSTPICWCSARWASATPPPPPPWSPRSSAATSPSGSAAAPASTTRVWHASATRCAWPSTASPASSIRWRCCARWAAPSWSRSPRRSSPRDIARLPVLLDGYVVTASALAAAPYADPAPSTTARSVTARPSPGHRRLLAATRQAAAARPRHAAGRRLGGDGRRAAGGDGVCRHHRGADVRGVVRLTGLLAAVQFLTRIPIRLRREPDVAASVAVVPARRRHDRRRGRRCRGGVVALWFRRSSPPPSP